MTEKEMKRIIKLWGQVADKEIKRTMMDAYMYGTGMATVSAKGFKPISLSRVFKKKKRKCL